MYLKGLKINGFRNIESADLSFNKNVNVIVGENAQGKTNLLESIFLLSGNRSFRGSKDNEMLNQKTNSFYVEGDFSDNGEQKTVKYAAILDELGIKKRITKNDLVYRSPKVLVGEYPMTSFSPDDLQLVKGSPSLRRNFLDSLLCSLFPTYLSNLGHYEKFVLHKNKLLKDGKENIVTDVYSMQMAKYGTSIILSRLELIDRLKPYLKKFFFEMSEGRDEIEINYECSAFDTELINEKEPNELSDIYLNKMRDNEFKEKGAGQCLYGPHRDELKILINGKEAKSFASQGQIRSAVIAFILSKTELLKLYLNKEPIVILDDVMSELDKIRQRYILDKISDFQVFISCCQKEIFEFKQNKNVFEVKKGEIFKIEE